MRYGEIDLPFKWMNEEEIESEEFRAISDELKKRYAKVAGIENLGTHKEWELPFIVLKIKEQNGIRILDFGAGISPLGAYLHSLNYDVTLLDLHDGWHKKIGEGEYNEMYDCLVRYPKLDILKDMWRPGDFDVIFSASVLEHIYKPEILPILNELKARLTPDGLHLHIVDHPSPVIDEVAKFYNIGNIEADKHTFKIRKKTRIAFY